MTPDELKRLRELCEKATAGPWKSDYCGDVWTISGEVPHVNDGGMELFQGIGTTTRGPDNGNAAFIAAARTAVPALLDEVERLEEENAMLRGKIPEHLAPTKILAMKQNLKIAVEALNGLTARHVWITEPTLRNWKDVCSCMTAEAGVALAKIQGEGK